MRLTKFISLAFVALLLSACAANPRPTPRPTPTPTPTPTVCLTPAAAVTAITAAFKEHLTWFGRPDGKPDPDGLADYTSRLVSCHLSRGLTVEGLNADIKASPEYALAHPRGPPIQPPGTQPRTEAQLRDFQGDLMVWCPAVKPVFVNGVDPKTGIRAEGDPGWVPHGIREGWVWTLWIPYYPADQREVIYQCILSEGYTHVAQQVARATVGGGYHGVRPNTEADVAQWGGRVNTVLLELRAKGLIQVCAGVAPDEPLAPGIDVSLCPIAMNDWDNTDQPFCRLKVLSETFPNALLYFEITNSSTKLAPDACSPAPWPTERRMMTVALSQQFPRFRGFLLEVDSDQGHEPNVARYEEYRKTTSDFQQVFFESDTYQKFWPNLSREEARQRNDRLMAALTWLHGCMSGCTTHPPPAAPAGTVTQMAVELDLREATIMESAGLSADWPVTTRIDKLSFDQDVHLTFSKQDGPDRWPNVRPPGWDGDLQYTLGMVMKGTDGKWYAASIIQFWHGLGGNGGTIGDRSVDGVGQVPANWTYYIPQMRRQPAVGELVGFFVVSGDMRMNANNGSVRERSNVVLVPFPGPAGASFVFTYGGSQRVH